MTGTFWLWFAAVLAVWTLIILTALRWLGDRAAAGARFDAAMAGCPHLTEACEFQHHDSCWKQWCRCECHAEFSSGRADPPPSGPGAPP